MKINRVVTTNFGGLELRQAIYVPVFEVPDKATFTTEIKSKILQSALAPRGH